MKKRELLVMTTMIFGLLNPIRTEAAIRPDVPTDNEQAALVYSCEECVAGEHVQLHYIVMKEEETLDSISLRFALGEDYIHTVNPQYEKGTEIPINSSVALPEPIYWPDVTDRLYYWIKDGDNLTKISERFDSSISELLELNPTIENPNRIYAGELLKVI